MTTLSKQEHFTNAQSSVHLNWGDHAFTALDAMAGFAGALQNQFVAAKYRLNAQTQSQ